MGIRRRFRDLIRQIVDSRPRLERKTAPILERFFVCFAMKARFLANGYEEARRGAYDPTYLYYTLGKPEIMKLRSDYAKVMGTAYSLGKSHTEFVKQGRIPINVIRKILIPGDTASVL